MTKLTQKGREIYNTLRKDELTKPRASKMCGGRTWDGKKLSFEYRAAHRCLLVARMIQSHNYSKEYILKAY